MALCLDPILVPLLAILIWPLVKSSVFLTAAAMSIWSRDARRRAAARHLVRLIGRPPDESPD